jgi:hypothetical protein
VTVPSSVSSISLTATVSAGSNAIITDGSGNLVTMPVPINKPTTSKTVTVVAEDRSTSQEYTLSIIWLGQGTITVHFTGAPQDETTPLWGMGTGNVINWLTDSLTLTAPTTGIFSGASYQWYKDGTIISGETASTLTILAQQFSIAPSHELTVKITTAAPHSVVYSKTITFEVE